MKMERQNLRMRADGRFRLEILEGGKRVKRLPWQKNLVTDSGLDGIAVRQWGRSMTYCAIGTGTTPMHLDSGTTTASRTGTTVAANGSIFTTDHVGGVIKWDSGEESYIQSFTSPTEVETVDSGAVASGEFTIHRVDLTQHDAETKRSNSYVTGVGNCGTVHNGTTRTVEIFRTFIFTAEAGAVTYNEIGVSHTGTAGANLFARAVISGGVSLAAGQQLRVLYSLTITLDNPSTLEAITAPITGIPSQSANQQAYLRGIEEIDTNGAAKSSLNQESLEPATAKKIGVFESSPGIGSPPLAGFTEQQDATNSANVKSVGAAAAASYVAGNFYMDFARTVATTDGNAAAGLTYLTVGSGFYAGLVVVMDTAIPKTSDDTLSLTFRLSWGRNLVN